MPKPACELRPLASSRVCHVELCDHGTFHVSVGPVSLRLTAAQLHAVQATLAAAVAELEPPAPERDAKVRRLLC